MGDHYRKYAKIFETYGFHQIEGTSDYVREADEKPIYEYKNTGNGKRTVARTLPVNKEERFRQCYLPPGAVAYNKARHQLPKTWFCSNQGNLLRVHGANVEWVPSNRSITQRECYTYIEPHSGNLKNKYRKISSYSLVALVFMDECTVFPKEAIIDRLNKCGLSAFIENKKNGEYKLDGHHYGEYGFKNAGKISDAMQRRAFVNVPEHILLTFNYIHKNFDKTIKNEKHLHEVLSMLKKDTDQPFVYWQRDGGYRAWAKEDSSNALEQNQILQTKLHECNIILYPSCGCSECMDDIVTRKNDYIKLVQYALKLDADLKYGSVPAQTEGGIDYDLCFEILS